ncbi:MAG: hypothetical protein HY296_08475 [Thaumarchaeota archaeon]|nr:hypothetical protein [Nitrososphaerota archaeon]
MAFRVCDIESEAELEAILTGSPSSIEDGFRILKSQRRTKPYGKRLDLDGVDSEGTLTVVELKLGEDNSQLLQALEYYDYLLERGLSFFRAYSNVEIEDKPPRIILIAKSFDERTKKVVKYVSEEIQVTLKQIALCYEIGGSKHVQLLDLELPRKQEIEEKPASLEGLEARIKNEEVRKAWKETIKMIEELDPSKVRITLLPYRVNFSHSSKGLKFAEMYPKREFFWLNWKSEPEWEGERVRTLEAGKQYVNEKVLPAMRLLLQK